MKDSTQLQNQTYSIHIKGLVQGVGFRPFIYRIANQQGLSGWVTNRNDGVQIKITTKQPNLEVFVASISTEAPPASRIEELVYETIPQESFTGFTILKSRTVSEQVTQVSPDIAVCQDCLNDMKDQPHRLDYPFINCTHCGPRFSIIRSLPYDRPNTTMDVFPMCQTCQQEYEDITDRRFHAQPVACSNCGPSYTLHLRNDRSISQLSEILKNLASGLDVGKIYALKGMGGYNLACDASNQEAVLSLRNLKTRARKPFAVLCKSIQTVEQIAYVSTHEKDLLLDPSRPIVLLKDKGLLSPAVSFGLDRVGLMLPYLPLHYQLFQTLKTSTLVFTSGNISDEPIIIDDQMALDTFLGLTEGVLTHNRLIYNRVDDSVVKRSTDRTQMIRRSRGYAPSPLVCQLNTEGIFAAGAELCNSFALGKGNQVILSQYLGDLKHYENFEFFEESFSRYQNMFRFQPELVAIDCHPNYLSSTFGQRLAKKHQLPLIQVQHHHAHIAAVLLEKHITEPVIGICLDGLGYGSDNSLWGAEILVADLISFKRMGHFKNIGMPGMDQAAIHTWRMGLAYLHQCAGTEALRFNLPMFREIDSGNIEMVWQLLEHQINTPLVTSAGRLFDAVAALCGLCYENNYQAEAPMLLEAQINPFIDSRYPYQIREGILDFSAMILEICRDVEASVPVSTISTKFHRSLVDGITQLSLSVAKEVKLTQVVLSGGSFQNSFLLKHLYSALSRKGMQVYVPEAFPVNDQGIAIGQLAVAAAKRKKGLNSASHA